MMSNIFIKRLSYFQRWITPILFVFLHSTMNLSTTAWLLKCAQEVSSLMLSLNKGILAKLMRKLSSKDWLVASTTATSKESFTEISSPKTFCLKRAKTTARWKLLILEPPKILIWQAKRSWMRESEHHSTSHLRFWKENITRNVTFGQLVLSPTCSCLDVLHSLETPMKKSMKVLRKVNAPWTVRLGKEFQKKPKTSSSLAWLWALTNVPQLKNAWSTHGSPPLLRTLTRI